MPASAPPATVVVAWGLRDVHEEARAFEARLPNLDVILPEFARLYTRFRTEAPATPIDAVLSARTLERLSALVLEEHSRFDRTCHEGLRWLHKHGVPAWRVFGDFGALSSRRIFATLRPAVEQYGYARLYEAMERVSRGRRRRRPIDEQWKPKDVKAAQDALAEETAREAAESGDAGAADTHDQEMEGGEHAGEQDRESVGHDTQVGVDGDTGLPVQRRQDEREGAKLQAKSTSAHSTNNPHQEEQATAKEGEAEGGLREAEDRAGAGAVVIDAGARGRLTRSPLSAVPEESSLLPTPEQSKLSSPVPSPELGRRAPPILPQDFDIEDSSVGLLTLPDGINSDGGTDIDNAQGTDIDSDEEHDVDSAQGIDSLTDGDSRSCGSEDSGDYGELDNSGHDGDERAHSVDGVGDASLLESEAELTEQALHGLGKGRLRGGSVGLAHTHPSFVTQRSRKRASSLSNLDNGSHYPRSLDPGATLQTAVPKRRKLLDLRSPAEVRIRAPLTAAQPPGDDTSLEVTPSTAAPKKSPTPDFTIQYAIHSMQEDRWLSGTAIDTVLNCLNPNPSKIYTVDAIGCISTSNPEQNRRARLRRLRPEHRVVIIPINHRNAHWTIAIALRGERRILLYDPQHNRTWTQSAEVALRQYCHCLDLPPEPASSSNLHARWNIEIAQHTPVQLDAQSCGVLILVFALYHMAGLPVPTAIHPVCWRQTFGGVLQAVQAKESGTEYAPPRSISLHATIALPEASTQQRDFLGPEVCAADMSIARHSRCAREYHQIRQLLDALTAPHRAKVAHAQNLLQQLQQLGANFTNDFTGGVQNLQVQTEAQTMRSFPHFSKFEEWVHQNQEEVDAQLRRAREAKVAAEDARLQWLRQAMDAVYQQQQQR